MGEVWQALQVSLGRMVAIKRVRGDQESRGEKWDRLTQDFTCEAIVAGRLEHPNIVPVHDLCTDQDGAPILAMKLVEGREWSDLLEEDFSALPTTDFLSKHIPILMGMVQAVAFAHSRGVVHRDLKPAQVMVGEFGEVLLSDWGLAVLTSSADRRFQNLRSLPTTDTATSPSGTPALMAPEQTKDVATAIGPWTDIYLIGGTLYHLLTRTYPHQAQNARMSIQRAASGIIVSPSDRESGRDIPRELEDLCLRCLSAEPGQRPASAAVVLQELRDFLTGTSRRKESAELAAAIEEKFPAPHKTSYEALEATWAGLARAGELWPGNPVLPALRERTLSLYSQTALEGRDLRLARLHAGRMAPGPKKLELVASIDAEEERIASEHRARRNARLGLAAALLVILVGGAAFTISLSRARRQAVADRDRAREARAEEAAARKQADAALAEADELIGFMVGDLGNRLTTIGRLEILDTTINKVDELIKHRSERGLQVADSKYQVTLLLQMSLVRRDQGLLPESEALARSACDLASKAMDAGPTAERRKDVALSWLHLGNTLIDLGKAEEAVACLSKARDQATTLHNENPADDEAYGYLGDAWNRMGNAQSLLGDLEQARASFEKCLVISEELLARDPSNPRWTECVAGALGQLGTTLRMQGKLVEARAALERRLAIWKKEAAAAPDNVAFQRDLAQAHNSLSRVIQAQGNLEEARSHLDQALAIRERLAYADPTNADAQHDVASSLSRIGGIQQIQGNFDAALETFRRAQDIHSILASDPSNHERQRELAVITGRVGDILEEQGDLTGALSAYLECRDVNRRLATMDPANADWQRELGLSWQKIADCHTKQKQFDEAAESCRTAVEIAERLAAADPSNAGWQHDLRGALRASGGIHQDLDQIDRARADLQRAIQISEQLVITESSSPSSQSELAVSWGEMAGLLKGEKKFDEACAAYQKSLAVFQALSASEPTNADYRCNGAICQLEVGNLLGLQEKFDEALEVLNAARNTFQELSANSPGSTAMQSLLAEAHYRLGILAQGRGDTPTAVTEWGTALTILEACLAIHPDDRSNQAMADKIREKITAAQSPSAP